MGTMPVGQKTVAIRFEGLTAGAYTVVQALQLLPSVPRLAELAIQEMLARRPTQLFSPRPIPAFRSWGPGEHAPPGLLRLAGPISPTRFEIRDEMDRLAAEGGIGHGTGEHNHTMIAQEIAMYLAQAGPGTVTPIIPGTPQYLEQLKGRMPRDPKRDLRLVATAALHATTRWSTERRDLPLIISTNVLLGPETHRRVMELTTPTGLKGAQPVCRWLVSAYVAEQFHLSLGFNVGISEGVPSAATIAPLPEPGRASEAPMGQAF